MVIFNQIDGYCQLKNNETAFIKGKSGNVNGRSKGS